MELTTNLAPKTTQPKTQVESQESQLYGQRAEELVDLVALIIQRGHVDKVTSNDIAEEVLAFLNLRPDTYLDRLTSHTHSHPRI